MLSPVIESFNIVKPKLVVKGRNLWRVEVVYQIAENQEFKRLGEARLANQDGVAQTWEFPIPESPVNANTVAAKGYGWRKSESTLKLLPYVGSSLLFNALWQTSTGRFISLAIGEIIIFDDLHCRLLRIVEDSRCPADIVCEKGVFRAEFELETKNGKETVTLDMASRDYDFAGFSVKIVNVTPPKIHNREIKLSESRVGLYLQRQRKF